MRRRFRRRPSLTSRARSRRASNKWVPSCLLDASGLSRLFGSAQELGEHLRDALSKQSPGGTATACCDCLDANRRDAACPRQSRPHRGRCQAKKRSRSRRSASACSITYEQVLHAECSGPCTPALSTPAPQHLSTPAPQHLSTRDLGWQHPRASRIEASRAKPTRARESPARDPAKWGIRSLGALTALAGPEIHERLGERGAPWQTLARGRRHAADGAVGGRRAVRSGARTRMADRRPRAAVVRPGAITRAARRTARARRSRRGGDLHLAAPHLALGASRARCSCRRRCAIRRRCAR